MKELNVGILGAGWIASMMADTLAKMDAAVPYAIASRNMERAEEYAQKWGFQRAYNSYEALVDDPNVDIVYIATPHSHHYEHTKLCLEHRKPVLVEKAFTVNAAQAKQLIDLAHEKKVFLCEAIWTRFLPGRTIIRELLNSGIIGVPQRIEADFSQSLVHMPRLIEPALAGGSLLDLGVYGLTFASMYFGDDIKAVESRCKYYRTGVDEVDDIHIIYTDGKTADIHACFNAPYKNEGIIYGTAGHIKVDGLNNYEAIRVYDQLGTMIQECPIPAQITGYEHEVLACKYALEAGQLECAEMPHAETLEIMRQMDSLRNSWNIRYPIE